MRFGNDPVSLKLEKLAFEEYPRYHRVVSEYISDYNFEQCAICSIYSNYRVKLYFRLCKKLLYLNYLDWKNRISGHSMPDVIKSHLNNYFVAVYRRQLRLFVKVYGINNKRKQ